MELTYCIPCQHGDHDDHQSVPQPGTPGLIGSRWECPCEGECVDAPNREMVVVEYGDALPNPLEGTPLFPQAEAEGPKPINQDALSGSACNDLKGLHVEDSEGPD